jgi:adenosylhomocysteine nucleosidase
MMKPSPRGGARLLLALLSLVWAAGPAAVWAQGPPLDKTPRIALISAFPPELAALERATEVEAVYAVRGTRFVAGRLEGREVVLLLSGVSMVNAAMNAERAAAGFNLTAMVFSGIAGGVDPALAVGDVVVPDRWGQYLESVMARETAPGIFAPPQGEPLLGPHLGMIFPKAVEGAGPDGAVRPRFWFAADPALLERARRAGAGLELRRCVHDGLCLKAPPKVVVGGAGVSGPSFVDNAALRSWLSQSLEARCVDMESAAVAQVAAADGVPFIAFRSLSDLAGGDPGANQARVFFQLAADNSAAAVRAFLRAPAQPLAR